VGQVDDLTSRSHARFGLRLARIWLIAGLIPCVVLAIPGCVPRDRDVEEASRPRGAAEHRAEEPLEPAATNAPLTEAPSVDGGAGSSLAVRFTDEQVDFLVEQFVAIVREMTDSAAECGTPGPCAPSKVPTKVDVSRAPTSVKVWGAGERGYLPGVEFSPTYDSRFSSDLDGDGYPEILFSAEETAGGTAAWNSIYCLSTKTPPELKRLEVPCPCKAPLRCQDSPSPELLEVKEGSLVIAMECLAGDDAQCCPSHHDKVLYGYQRGSLKLRSILSANDTSETVVPSGQQ
jgi:hypothetical protein